MNREIVVEKLTAEKFKKFGDVVEPVIGQKIEVPARLQEFMRRKKVATLINADFKELKDYLLSK